jgi:cytoskeletal protein CcmA (bactofilin family)
VVPTPIESKRPSAFAAQSIITATPRTSVISKALKITGQLESTEDIQIDGQVDGDVRANCVKVGSNARVKGGVYAEEVEVSGTVEGKIEAKKVVLTSTAHMSGDILHQEIAIQSGAFMDGHCSPDFGKSDAKKIIVVHKPALAQ